MRVREAREEGLLELETHLVESPVEWTQAIPSTPEGWVPMEWQVRAWLEQHAGLDIGEATEIYQRARAWFCGARQPAMAMATFDAAPFFGGEPVPARLRLLPAEVVS